MRSRTEPGRSRPRARKRFGQHFLEPVWARKVVDAVGPGPGDLFVEIGPGPGAITRPLAAASRALVACELDRDLAAALRAEQIPNVTVVEGDFLTLPAARLEETVRASGADGHRLRVAGNLPYNVASPIMFRLIELSRGGLPIVDATLMLQREVADRLLAVPGTAEYGLLTVLVGHRAAATRLLNLPPGAFRPAPKVRSSVVRLVFHDAVPAVADERRLAAVAQALFSRRRKTLSNALQAYGGLTADSARAALARTGLDSSRRPETLTLAELCRLSDEVGGETPPNRPPVPVV